jgi:hypothetical protein
MVRTVIGGLAAGIALFLVGFIFWGTPLSQMAFSTADEAHNAAVQTTLAQNLTETGTGTYQIPDMRTPQGTTLYGQGPIATIHFNTSGFPSMDTNMLIVGFVFALVSGTIMAFGLAAVGSGRSFGEMARLVILYSLGFTIWTILAMPVFNHFGWAYWIYSFVSGSIAWIVAGLIVIRWFLPHHRIATAPSAEPAKEA